VISEDLDKILAYTLVEKGTALRVKVFCDPDQDDRNQKDPRAFAYVEEGSFIIHAARNIERLPANFRVGILLHEIGHIVIKGFHGPDSEVDVDQWVLDSFPEANYDYEDAAYIDTFTMDRRIASDLQYVGDDFVALLGIDDE
jgi:hypothetical protein